METLVAQWHKEHIKTDSVDSYNTIVAFLALALKQKDKEEDIVEMETI